MYGKYLGLDIGSDSIKIALVKRGLRETKLLTRVKIKTPESPNQVSELVDAIFTQNSFPRGDIATSIPNHPISIRVLNFPFSDPKKIDQVYEFELENVTTFDPLDKVHGYQIVKTGKGSEVIVCMFEKESLKGLMELFDRGGIDPKVVTYAPVAFSSLDSLLVQERPLVLIDIGASDMNFTLFDKGGVKRVRSSSKAGNAVTETIKRILRVPLEEAESIKLGGLEGDNPEVVREALTPLLGEIKKTIQFFEIELREEVKTILLSGGTSLMPGITNFMGRELKKDVKKLFIPELGDDSTVFAESFALALYGCTFSKGNLDLRKGEFKYTGKNEELRKTFLVPAALFLVFLLLSMYRSGAGYFELKDRISKMEAQIELSVRETFPDVKIIPKPAAFMESEVKKVREQLGLIEGIQGSSTPLNILRDISANIPQRVKLTVDEVNFLDDSTVKVQGKCNSYDEVARIEKALSDSGLFKKVNRDSTETAVNNTIKFQISLVLR